MSITGATKVYAIIGDPVAHSLSPLMQNGWIADHNIDAVYVALPVKSDDPVSAIRARTGFAGLNVTVPHKEAAAKAAARSASAVANVLRREEDGTFQAFNTDGQGFLDSLTESVPDWRSRVRRVLIVGAGGAAVGIGQALSPFVDTIHFANRTASRGEETAALIPNARTTRWDDLERAFGHADLIVQTTTLGMADQPEMAWPVSFCRPSAIVADIVYRPLETDLLRAAKAHGLSTVDGLGMLIHHGARSFEIWFEVKPDIAKARARLMAALA
jgi:shikimate dehydrogenase